MVSVVMARWDETLTVGALAGHTRASTLCIATAHKLLTAWLAVELLSNRRMLFQCIDVILLIWVYVCVNLHESTIYISIYIVYSFSISKWPIEMNIDYIYSVPVAVIWPFSGGVQCWRRRNKAMAGSDKRHRFGHKGGSFVVWIGEEPWMGLGTFGRLELPIDFRSLKLWWKGPRKTLRAAICFFFEM